MDGNSSDSPYKSHQMEITSACLRVDEDGLRRAGINSYLIEVRTCTNGRWNTLYTKKADLLN